MSSILPSDRELTIPDLTVITASAGAGKTRTLTLRFLQLLLSDRILHADLPRILAVTFTNNAATEMKHRVLSYLKRLVLGKPDVVEAIRPLVSLSDDELKTRAHEKLLDILDRYSDLQVRTIDSFLINVFRTTALEQGLPPSVEVLIGRNTLLDRALDRFSRDAANDEERFELLRRVSDLAELADQRSEKYSWNPYRRAAENIVKLRATVRKQTRPPDLNDLAPENDRLRNALSTAAEELEKALVRLDLPVKKLFLDDLHLLKDGRAHELLNRASRRDAYLNKPPKGHEDAVARHAAEIEDAVKGLFDGIARLAYLDARAQPFPALALLSHVEETLKEIARREVSISLDDLHAALRTVLNKGSVPEVFYSLGETIHHYLIDEFQDTAPIQWHNLKPLLEEVVAKDGTLFVVGDTKQSIYGFRGADWQIMKRLSEGKEFESVTPRNLVLPMNFRSDGAIVEFNRRFFQKTVPASAFAQAGVPSGLADYEQEPRPEVVKKGRAEVRLLEVGKDREPERDFLKMFLDDCTKRGYQYGDVAVLTPANEDVVAVSSWLNGWSIPFVSHSTLDIRKRKVVAEVLSLPRFLESPSDDLAFTQWITGEAFSKAAQGFGWSRDRAESTVIGARSSAQKHSPLYRRFQEEAPDLWQALLADLFAGAGFLPVYDLVTDVLKLNKAAEYFPGEAAAFVRLLETARACDDAGTNTLQAFNAVAADEESADDWNITVPETTDAVKLMTIHKAKGLAFPAVFVLLYDRNVRPRNLLTDETGDEAVLLRVTEKLAEKNPLLQAMYAEGFLREQVDTLNKLYVAFTRAEHEMSVAVVHGEKKKDLARLFEDTVVGTAAERVSRKMSAEPEAAVAPRIARLRVVPSDIRRVGRAEVRRGETVHAILAAILNVEGDVHGIVASAAESAAAGKEIDGQYRDLTPVVERFLSLEAVRPWFAPVAGRTVLTEVEFVDGSGQLFRCDRVVVDTDRITVVDFKTGGKEREEEYRDQVRTYVDILSKVYAPKPVSGLIAYVDLLSTLEVR